MRFSGSARGLLLFAFWLFALPAETSGKTVFVSKTGDDSSGLTWDTALTSLRQAAGVAVSGDHIWIKEGVYSDGPLNLSGEKVYGGFAGTELPEEFHLRDAGTNETILTAEGFDSSLRYIVLAQDDCVLDGVIIQGGEDTGLHIGSGSPHIVDCVIRDNVGGFMRANDLHINGGVCIFTIHLPRLPTVL